MKTVYYIPMQLLTYRNMPTLLEVVQTEVKKKKLMRWATVGPAKF